MQLKCKVPGQIFKKKLKSGTISYRGGGRGEGGGGLDGHKVSVLFF